MFNKSKLKCEKLTKNNILFRASLRGIKKCSSCGCINGQRALLCRNVNCDLRLQKLASMKPFDPIQLITYDRTKLYSLRTKEKLLQPRNFVSLTEHLGPTKSQSTAICYEDNCKYDAYEPNHLACRHIKACKVLTNVPQAEVYSIDKSILWNLNIPVEQKQHLWDLYQLEEKLIHPVQKINSSTFVVKCMESKTFPAGRLHATVFSNKVFNKRGTFSCSCKKLKIILEPDNSVTMKQEICDHVLLILAAILNKPEGKSLYGKFLDLLQYLWMPTTLNTPIVDCGTRDPQFLDYDLSQEMCDKPNIKVENVQVSDNSVDIFNFTEDIFADNHIPDFSDSILKVSGEETSELQIKTEQKVKLEKYMKDPKLNATTSSLNDEDMKLIDILKSAEPLTSSPIAPTDLNEKVLNVIEQFQLNHNMQVSNENIELAKDIESLNILESQVMERNSKNIAIPPCITKQKSLLKISKNSSNTAQLITKSCTNPTNRSTTIPASNSVVFNSGSVKILNFTTAIKKLPVGQKSKIIQISNIIPKNMIENQSNQNADFIKQNANNCKFQQPNEDLLPNCMEHKQINSITEPSLSYETWLDHIIEVLNESITIKDSPIKNSFYVPETMFNHFCKSFTLKNNKRLPNTTSVIKSGKYKDHKKYIWYLDQVSTAQRIFASKNIKIELSRSFQRLADGSYELYTPATIKTPNNYNFRPIYPKLQLYEAFIQFSNNRQLCPNSFKSHKCGFKLEWLPSACPKSNFGLMTIEYCVSVKEPDKTL